MRPYERRRSGPLAGTVGSRMPAQPIQRDVELSVANDFPRLADRYMERTTFESQKTTKPAGDRPSNLYEPVEHDGGERGQNWSGRTKSTSLYTKAALHRDVIGAAAAVGLGLVAATAAARRLTERSRGGPREDVPAPDKASANESDSR